MGVFEIAVLSIACGFIGGSAVTVVTIIIKQLGE